MPICLHSKNLQLLLSSGEFVTSTNIAALLLYNSLSDCATICTMPKESINAMQQQFFSAVFVRKVPGPLRWGPWRHRNLVCTLLAVNVELLIT